jgi:DNA-binding NtrC family response regulator
MTESDGQRTTAQRAGDPPRVLVVDDDAVLATAVVRILEPAFKVTYAQSASGALGRIRSARFAAVVCDVSIPGMSGTQLYDEVSSFDPELAQRMIFITGASDDAAFVRFVERAKVAFLPKPFNRHELAALVAKTAARARSQE